MTLRDLKPGDCGTVSGFVTEEVPARLWEMGLLPGTRVEVLRLAPLGDPMDLRVRGYRLSIRKAEAALVEVAHKTP